jgi:hypothetical protein
MLKRLRQGTPHGWDHLLDGASFVPLGLDEQWTGHRWFGGWNDSDGRVTRFELAHGNNPLDANAALVRVAVRSQGDAAGAQEFESFMVAQELVQHFWAETGTLPEAVRRAAFPWQISVSDPVAPWDHAAITINEAPVEFRVLTHDSCWVALARYRGALVSVQARKWPIATTGLVSMTNLTHYYDG